MPRICATHQSQRYLRQVGKPTAESSPRYLNGQVERFVRFFIGNKERLGKLGNLGSLGNNGNYGSNGITDKTLCVAILFFGFRGYPRRGYDEKERYGAAKFI